MHLLLKAWMKLRWPLLEQWQKGFATKAWWDSCGPGFSCLDVAVRRLIEYECTHSVSEHRITLFLDLSCFYETIGHSRLVEHADAVSFPPLLLWGALCAYRGPRLLTADGLIGPPAFASKGILAGCPLAVALSKVALWPACSKVLNQKAVATADTWVDDLSVDFCGSNPQQVAAKGLRVAKALFGALAEEGLEVSFRKTTWIASSPAVEATLKQHNPRETLFRCRLSLRTWGSLMLRGGPGARTSSPSACVRGPLVALSCVHCRSTGPRTGCESPKWGASLPPFGGTRGWASAQSSCGPPALTRPRQAEGSNLAVLMLFSA